MEQDQVITVTDAARTKLLELRDDEEDGDKLGLRIEINGSQGDEFVYDLSFETVTKAALDDEIRNHDGLKVIMPSRDVPSLEGATLDYVDGGLVMRNPNTPAALDLSNVSMEGPIAEGIKTLLEEQINPALASHGVFVNLLGVDGDVAYTTMGGGCQGCAMSMMTLREGITAMIKEALPEVSEGVDLTDHDAGENPFYS